jgi:hypothetical protein
VVNLNLQAEAVRDLRFTFPSFFSSSPQLCDLHRELQLRASQSQRLEKETGAIDLLTLRENERCELKPTSSDGHSSVLCNA